MHDGDLTTLQYKALPEPMALMDRQWAPCRYNCPVHADVRGYIEQAAAGDFVGAIDTIRQRLPFAGICGRICHHPCEANCRRQDVDAPVAIREVKRYVAELAGAKGATVLKAAGQDKARVAIVGGGPAGMSAALELAKKGYRPAVFEKFPIAGGIPATAIPKYRLPREVIQIDVDWICAHGVELVTGVEIGKDKSIQKLRDEGFAAVLLAAGLSKSRMLPMPGADHKRVLPVLKFLEGAAFDRPLDMGKDVLVIGGGNVAVDAARTAVRMGAARVRMMCLEALDEMPAWSWERAEALEEGVTFINRRGPVEVVVKGGQVVGLKHRKVTRVFDENKRFAPQYDDSDQAVVECDTIIMAIGQMADLGFAAGSGLAVDQRGRLTFNPATQQTNIPEIFACGEVVTPPGSAVEACASGQRAARAIDMFLSGKAIAMDDTLPPYIGKLNGEVGPKVIKVDRMPVPTREPAQRKADFAPVDANYTQLAAMAEARRCMNCGSGAEVLVDKCAACQTCVRVCPFGIPKVTNVARIDSALCQACGMCIAECPAGAIISRGDKVADRRARVAAALATGSRVIAFVCGHRANASQWKGLPALDGVAEIFLPSVAGLDVADLLMALEQGAASVLVVAARKGDDRFPHANARIKARVDQARNLLLAAGANAERVKLFELTVS